MIMLISFVFLFLLIDLMNNRNFNGGFVDVEKVANVIRVRNLDRFLSLLITLFTILFKRINVKID